MALSYYPHPGQVLFCDFSQGFKVPEMVKANRPVVVLTGVMQGRAELVTVAALSSVEPSKVMPYHLLIPQKMLPRTKTFMRKDTWLKGDMIYTVGFHRLDCVKLPGRDPNTGKRAYYHNRFSRDFMKCIYGCVLNGMGLNNLPQYL